MTTARSVPEWKGRTPDEAVPPRVRARVFDRAGGKCHRCGRKIVAETWTCEHLVALVNGGANAERNLGVTCNWCLPAKNAEDVAEKSEVARVRKKHVGIAAKRFRPIPGSKASGWRHRMDGTWERRNSK